MVTANPWLQRHTERKREGFLAAETEREGSRILAVENTRGRLKDCCLQRQKEMKDQGFLAAETERGTVRHSGCRDREKNSQAIPACRDKKR